MQKSSASAARLFRKIAALEERYRHELMDEDERCELRETIVRLKARARATGVVA